MRLTESICKISQGFQHQHTGEELALDANFEISGNMAPELFDESVLSLTFSYCQVPSTIDFWLPIALVRIDNLATGFLKNYPASTYIPGPASCFPVGIQMTSSNATIPAKMYSFGKMSASTNSMATVRPIAGIQPGSPSR